jgi:homogentisate 1,2-dioxygenase
MSSGSSLKRSAEGRPFDRRECRDENIVLQGQSPQTGTYRDSCFGPVTQFYHLHPPTDWKRIEGLLRPRAFKTYDLIPTDLEDPQSEPARVLYNNDVALFVSRRSEPMPFCFRNGDGDEIHFIHKGRGVLQSDFGPLQYNEGDYIVVPKGTSYGLCPRRPTILR